MSRVFASRGGAKLYLDNAYPVGSASDRTALAGLPERAKAPTCRKTLQQNYLAIDLVLRLSIAWRPKLERCPE